MIEFFGDVLTVMTALLAYERLKEWRRQKRYGG